MEENQVIAMPRIGDAAPEFSAVMCPLSTMLDMNEIIKWCNKVITF